MPRYFFHARLGAELVLDPLGVVIEDPSSIKRLLMETVNEFGLDVSPDWHFEVVEANGSVHAIVRIADLMRLEN